MAIFLQNIFLKKITLREIKQTIMQTTSIKSIQFSKMLVLLAMLAVSGCMTVSQQAEDWRSNWPEREYYVEHYYTDPGNAAVQKQEDYLKWIKRFYVFQRLRAQID